VDSLSAQHLDHSSAFLNQVALWSNFRFTVQEDGTSAGSKHLPDSHRIPLRQNLEFLANTRAPRPAREMRGFMDDRPFAFTAVGSKKLQIANTPAEITVLHCTAACPQLDGAPNVVTVEIGAHEVIESVAFMLERELRTGLESSQGCRADSELVDVVPYRLLEALGRVLAPKLSERQVLLCGLASLQSSDPTGQLSVLLEAANGMAERGEDVEAQLRKVVAAFIANLSTWLESELAHIDQALPLDEPFARSIKHTVKLIRSNFEARKRDAFFELQISSDIVKDIANMDVSVKAHGGCCVIQQRRGDPDQVGRDLMYDFNLGPPNPMLDLGLRMMHAGFRYIALHATETGVLPTDEIPLGKSKQCPFYGICDDPLRLRDASVCASQPWTSLVRKEKGEACWYSFAIRALRPVDLPADFLSR
jgi:hypothetical protein